MNSPSVEVSQQKSEQKPQAVADPLLAHGVALPDPAPKSALGWAALMGIGFGFAIQKGRIYEPGYIADQLAMRRFLMLKMFLTAAATSLFVTSLLSLTRFGRSRIAGARKWAFNGYRGVVGAVSGGFLLGIGMALSGACPGTGPVQVGAGVQAALFTFAGGILGAYVFGKLEPGLLQPSGVLKALAPRFPTFDSLLGLPFAVVGIAFAALMGSVAVGLEVMHPWRSELGIATPAEPLSLTSYAWPPWVAGLIIGSLQLPGLVFVRDTIGSSRAYVTIAANAARMLDSGVCSNPYFCGCRCGVGNYQQLTYLMFSMVGSYIAASLSGSFGVVVGFTSLASFAGGFLTVFGGRLAGGCTSGQGISGNAVLGVISPLATAAMFAGGMVTMALFF